MFQYCLPIIAAAEKYLASVLQECKRAGLDVRALIRNKADNDQATMGELIEFIKNSGSPVRAVAVSALDFH